jgi:dipeptidyl aminopeptidase/acylaminoacyl peptidase
MKPSTAILVTLLLTGPVAAQQKEWTPLQMMQVKRISGVQVSPDGKRVVYAVRQALLDNGKSDYLTHIHLANADGSGAVQLTQGDKSCDDPHWSPDGQWIAFGSTRAGKRNVWLIPPAGGEPTQLTHMKSAVTSFKWSPDSKSIAFTATDGPTPDEEKAKKEKNDARVVDANIKMSRLYVVAAATKEKQTPRLLTKGDYNVPPTGRGGYDWSPDGKTIIFTRTSTPHADDWPSAFLQRVDVESGDVTMADRKGAAEFAPHYSPDEQWIAHVQTDSPPTWAGTARIRVIPANGTKTGTLADTFDGFGRYSEIVGWSADSKHVYLTEAHGTVTHLGKLPFDGPPEILGKIDGFASGGIHLNAARTHFGFSWETLGNGPEAHLSAVERFEPKAVSAVNAKLPKLPLGPTEVIRWKSKDGLDIEGLLTYPANYEKGKRYPLLLNVHGGPAGVFTQTYVGNPGSYPIAAFSSRGYAVLRPNPRGSSGYGKKFRYANYNDWGGGDFLDLMTGVDHVIKLGVADENRLGVMGWSYGGFMTSWTITQTKRFKAASVGAGVTNLMSFTGTADIPSFLPDYFGGEFWDNPETYRKHSAMFNIKGVTTPTLIQHGERDERVPLSQGLELYNALKRQGCPTKMVIYPRTPHGIEEPRLLVDCMERNLEWFDRYVRK